MKITQQIAEKIVALIDTYGLCHGAGRSDTDFCVQQAVSKVVTEDKDMNSDNPYLCVSEFLVSFGIRLNDAFRESNELRGKALRRYALAELGTSQKFDSHLFVEKLMTKINYVTQKTMWFDVDEGHDFAQQCCDELGGRTNKNVKIVADLAADVLADMKTEGSEFLPILDEPNHNERVNKAEALGNKVWAAQMAEMGYKGYCITGKIK